MKEGIKYLSTLDNKNIIPGLERISSLLSRMGDPQSRLRSILVGGTNGKGSVASTLSSIMTEAGYKTGLYTSPHLERVTERIKIDGREIDEESLSQIIMQVKRKGESHGIRLSYFETITAASFLYFANEEVDFAILEVGMGGRWDATNVASPIVTVITNVSIDHTRFLGSTIPLISAEKAGIIRPGVPVVTGCRGSALRVVAGRAKELSSQLHVLGRDFNVEGTHTNSFHYRGLLWNLSDLRFGLLGKYQLGNAAISICAIERLALDGDIYIDEATLRRGLEKTRWGGRMEFLRQSPPAIMDGAHNPAGAIALRESLSEMFPGLKFTFLIAMSTEKDSKGFIKNLAPIAESIITTEFKGSGARRAEELRDEALGFVKDVVPIREAREAFTHAMALDTPICITGSLYLIGEIKSHLSSQLRNE
ncbi:MAG: folylpolyglutamate synthase/dihydrofolate synthase family protein [Candidatus Caldarchaeum sp.]